jgi:hypothetical protein
MNTELSTKGDWLVIVNDSPFGLLKDRTEQEATDFAYGIVFSSKSKTAVTVTVEPL